MEDLYTKTKYLNLKEKIKSLCTSIVEKGYQTNTEITLKLNEIKSYEQRGFQLITIMVTIANLKTMTSSALRL